MHSLLFFVLTFSPLTQLSNRLKTVPFPCHSPLINASVVFVLLAENEVHGVAKVF